MKRLCLTFAIILMVSALAGCGQRKPGLRGAYQSDAGELDTVEAVLISFDQRDSSFVEYFDCRQVDAGTFEKVKGDTYRLQSDRQDYEIVLTEGNAFEITLTKVNGGEPFLLKNVSDIPVEFGEEYHDIEEYQKLLD